MGIKDVENDTRIQRTGVVYNSLHPRWNAEFVFPLDITAPEDLFSGKQILMIDFISHRDTSHKDDSIHVHIGVASHSFLNNQGGLLWY